MPRIAGAIGQKSAEIRAAVLRAAEELAEQRIEPVIGKLVEATGLTLHQVRWHRERLVTEGSWPWRIRRNGVQSAVKHPVIASGLKLVLVDDDQAEYIKEILTMPYAEDRLRVGSIRRAHDQLGRRLSEDELDDLLKWCDRTYRASRRRKQA